MPEYRTDGALPEPYVHSSGLKMPVGLLAALVVGILALLGIGARYYAHADLKVIHFVLSLFFSINLLICYWEACLFFRRGYIERRTEYWRERRPVNSWPQGSR